MASTFQSFMHPAQGLFGAEKQPFVHTQYQQLDSSQSSPYTPHQTTAYYPGFSQDVKVAGGGQRTEKDLKNAERKTELVFGVADVCSAALAAFIEAVMGYMLYKFYQTRNLPSPGRTGPWHQDTQLWPTYMMASAALATFILTLTSVILAFREKKKANKRAQLSIKVIKYVIHIGCWIALAAFYRIAKTGTDLWGWSCSEKAEAIQTYYTNSLHFDTLCKIQSSTWVVSVIEVISKIVFAIVGFYFQFRLDRIRKLIARNTRATALEPMR